MEKTDTLSLLIKPASGACNMRCSYCFYADVSNIRKEKNMGMMSKETSGDLIRKAFETNARSISFAFQGGEPLLAGLEFFSNFVSLVDHYNKSGAAVSYAVQTNGTMISDEFAGFFSKNKFLVGVSVDGYKDIHDHFRRFPDGRGSFSEVLAGIALLKKHNADYNILTVLNNTIAKHIAKIYNFYKKSGFEFLQFIPCIDDFGHAGSPALSPQMYAYFLNTLFNYWFEDFIEARYISVRHIDNYVNILLNRPPENCAMGGRCGQYFTVEGNGSLYPCDFYCTDKYKLGSVYDPEPFLISPEHNAFIEDSFLIGENCRKCNYYFICRGGCKRDREPDYLKNRYCSAYKAFFDASLNKLRYVAEVIARR